MYHDHETAGHPGELETYTAVAQQYWWPGIRTFVKNYVKGCGICQQFKIDRNPSHPAFLPIPGAQTTRPFAHCSMDLITDLPLSNTFDSILVVVDQGLSKGVILCPCTTYRHYTVPDHPIQGTNTVYRTIRVHGAPRIRECDTKLGRMHYRQLLGLLYPPGGFGRCHG